MFWPRRTIVRPCGVRTIPPRITRPVELLTVAIPRGRGSPRYISLERDDEVDGGRTAEHFVDLGLEPVALSRGPHLRRRVELAGCRTSGTTALDRGRLLNRIRSRIQRHQHAGRGCADKQLHHRCVRRELVLPPQEDVQSPLVRGHGL